jgi:hypothetical protein
MRRERFVELSVVCVMLAAAAGVGYWFARPAPVVETPVPEIKQADGSVALPRAPDAKAKPKHMTPKGAKVERVGKITARGETPPEIAACTSAKCPPVTIDTSLVRMDDGSKRVIVSSPDGQILAGVDIPVETAAPPPEPPKWAAGLSLDPIRQTPGVWIERDIWRVRAGAEINQVKQRADGPSSAEIRLRVGLTF